MRSPRNDAWRGVVMMLALALFSFAYLANMELGRLRHQPLSADEQFFAACAARGLAVGQFPVAGCHDNKGPIISTVHQLVQLSSSSYDFSAIKMTAFAVVFLALGSAGLIAYRLGGMVAAVATMALLLQALVTDVSFFALKTETVGAVFLLLGLAILIGPKGRAIQRSSPALFFSGVLVGLAVMTRQTYAVVAIATVAWLGLSTLGSWAVRLRTCISKGLIFGVGVLAPVLLFLLVFFMDGREVEYLADLFVYPLVRSVPSGATPMHTLMTTVGEVMTTLASTPLLCILFSIAGARIFANMLSQEEQRPTVAMPQLLIFVSAIAMLLVIFVSPSYYSFHIIPVQVLMAVLSGVVVAELGSVKFETVPNKATYLTVILLASSILMAATSWHDNGRTTGMHIAYRGDALPKESRGAYAYILGMRPQFYAINGLIPASNLMFPWALSGLPANVYYQPPPANTWRGRLLAKVHQSNQDQLLADFHQTPPLYILVMHSMARVPGSSRIADIPGFDDYVRKNCVYDHEITAEVGRESSLFKCNTGT